MSDFILYDATNSPCARKVRMMLIENDIEFESRWLALAVMEQKQPWYLKLNPNGLVPTLLHGDTVIFDANVIIEYLDKTLPGSNLVPDSVDLQTQMRMWMAFEMEWAKPFRDVIYQTYAKKRLRETGVSAASLGGEIQKRTTNPAYLHAATSVLLDPVNEQYLSDRIAILMERMAWMEGQLTHNDAWLLGDDFSLADIALAPRLDMFSFIGVADFYFRYPLIEAYMNRIKARPSWARSEMYPD
jgi:glutathione S-transferase